MDMPSFYTETSAQRPAEMPSLYIETSAQRHADHTDGIILQTTKRTESDTVP